MALALQEQNIEPVMLIFCASSLTSPVRRLREFWVVYKGEQAFEFVRRLTNFDLRRFLQQEDDLIRAMVNKIFDMM
jgi:hypothetical protein